MATAVQAAYPHRAAALVLALALVLVLVLAMQDRQVTRLANVAAQHTKLLEAKNVRSTRQTLQPPQPQEEEQQNKGRRRLQTLELAVVVVVVPVLLLQVLSPGALLRSGLRLLLLLLLLPLPPLPHHRFLCLPSRSAKTVKKQLQL